MQIKLGSVGETITGIESLNQEIMLILTTPLNSVPHLPGYGSKIYSYLDRPENIARPLIVAEAHRAIKKNTSRFTPTSIKLLSASPGGKMLFKIVGMPNDPEIDKEVTLSLLADFTALRGGG